MFCCNQTKNITIKQMSIDTLDIKSMNLTPLYEIFKVIKGIFRRS